MPRKKCSVTSVDNDDQKVYCHYKEVSVCPICDYALVPKLIDGRFLLNENHLYSPDASYRVYITFLCPNCRNLFTVQYTAGLRSNRTDLETFAISNIYPRHFHKINLPDEVSKLSPMFVKILGQSAEAEANDLDEIAGCGYRKAVEYLVKDYLCHKCPQEEDAIKSEQLGNSIKRIKDHRIQILAQRAAWIGNDETHYVRKHESLDIDNMKQFISAMVQYIESELTFEAAMKVPPVK